MPNSSWYVFQDGSTIGLEGSERGTTLRDEEYPLGARITLERDTQSAPFAITCGIYGWMVHTRFFGLEIEATSEYDLMKSALSGLLDQANERAEDSGEVIMKRVENFVASYP